MKQFLTILIISCLQNWVSAQIHVAGGILKVSSGALLYSSGDVTNTGSGTLTNDGTLSAAGNITNSGSGTLEGDGQYSLEGDWTNAATFNAGMSTITFEGSSDSNIDAGGDELYNLELDKTGADLYLSGDLTISNLLHFASDNNKLILGSFNLTLGLSATLTGGDENNFIVTDGSGSVHKEGIGTTPFLFCIGFDENSPTPITLVQSGSGTVDNFSVRVLEHALDSGGVGNILNKDAVDASWHITEDTPGGSDLTLTMQWAATDELDNFDNSDCGISRYVDPHWDLLNADMGSAAGADPYTRQRSGVTELGYFAVGGEAVMDFIAVSPKAILQGAYSGGLMIDSLRSQSLIPLDEPYAAMANFTHEGRGGDECINATVFDSIGNNAIVDWVFLELRDKNDSTIVVETRSALIQRDGDVVETDGISAVKFRGLTPEDYFIAIRHRNHLGVCTDTVHALERATTPLDYSDGSLQLFGSNPLRDIGGGTYTMWSGNNSADDEIVYTGSGSDVISISAPVYTNPMNTGFSPSYPLESVYHLGDGNLDGKVIYTGSGSDVILISSSIYLNPANTAFSPSFPLQEQLPK